MAAESSMDKNAVFKKLKSKSENKVIFPFSYINSLFARNLLRFSRSDAEDRRSARSYSRSNRLFSRFVSDVFWLQRQESDMGVRYVRYLPLHRLLRSSSEPRRPHQLREVYWILFLNESLANRFGAFFLVCHLGSGSRVMDSFCLLMIQVIALQ